jgi:subtilisin family serine protease
MLKSHELSRHSKARYTSTLDRPVALMFCVLALATGTASAKKPVNTADDLPRHTYDIKGNALDLLKDKPAILAIAEKLKADADADLDGYDIKDRSILSAYQQLLQQIDMLNGRYDAALARIPTLRDLETREADKLLTGLSLTAHVAALKAATGQDGSLDQAKYDDAFKSELRAEIAKLPMDVIHDTLQQRRSTLKMVSADLVLAGVDQQINPLIAANPGKVPGEVASSLVTTEFLLDTGLHWAKLAGDVYGEFLDAAPAALAASKQNAAGAVASKAPEKKDIWTPTLVTLDKNEPATPVVVAIWDTGFDTSLFPDQLWTNPSPSPDGADLHGVAFDMDHHPATGDLYPLDALKTDKATCMSYIAAGMEMQAGLETPGVVALRNHVLSLKGHAVQDFTQDMGIIGNYAHGTHVAGIVAAGNPFVRLLKIRETFDYKEIPDHAPTLQAYEQWGESAQAAIDFAKAAHTRVVNMSWRIPREAVEGQLAIKGVGKTTEERAELSRQIFNAFKDRLEKAIAGAPDILFVAGAGNEDNDADFSEYIPAGLRLPNLLTVSAVDAEGKPTTFTTTGKNIDLYADGYEIDSLVPGGQHMKFSGTSMSSPQVANLAAKLIALNPQLTVEQTIQLIRKGATPLPGHQGKFIINPAASVALLKQSH